MVIVKDIFMKLADFVGNIVTGNFGKAFDNLGDIGKLIVEAVDNAITGILKMVGLDFEGNVSDVISRFFDGIFKSIKDAVNGVLDSIENLIRAIPGIGDGIADSIFGEQTKEEIALKEEKKKQVELAEKEEERKLAALRILEQKKRIDDKIEAEQARINRSEAGMDEYLLDEKGGKRSSRKTIDRLNFEKSRLEKQQLKLMPTANDNQKRTDQMTKDQVGLSAFGGAGTTIIHNDQSTKTSHQNNQNVSTVQYVGNPSPGFKQAAGSNVG
jgi:hypothetical protein